MELAKVRRQIRRRYVKVQSRMEAGIADRWVPTFASAILTGVLTRAAIVSWQTAEVGPSAGRYAEALTSLSSFEFPDAPISGASSSIAELFVPVALAPLALLVGWIEPVVLLLLTQALALSLTCIPLWFLARQAVSLRLSAACILVAAYAVHPLIHDLAVTDFHPESLAVPAIVTLGLASALKRWKLYWSMVAFLTLLRLDLGLAVAVWGLVQVRDGNSKIGIRTVSVAALWSLSLLLIVQPLQGVTEFSWGENLFRRENFDLAVPLFVPFLFTSFLAPRYMAPAVPVVLLHFASDGIVDFGTPVPVILGFASVAAAYAMRRLGDLGVNSVFVDVRLLGAMAFASLVMFVTASPLSPYERPWQRDEDTALSESLDSAITQIAAESHVRASSSAATQIAGEFDYSEFSPNTRVPTAVSATQNDADAVLIVRSDFEELGSSGVDSLTSQLATLGFQVSQIDENVLVYQRES